MATLAQIVQYHPETDDELARMMPEFLRSDSPAYLNLRR